MKKFIILAAIVLCGNCVFATEAKMFKLANGQTVVIQEVRNNPIVTIDTWIKTGSIDEDDSNNGVAHFLEHLFFKGTKNHQPGEFDRILETKGAITNAATSKDFTHYYITIPSAYFDTALDLHADMLSNPQIPRKELEQERKVVLEEIEIIKEGLVFIDCPLLFETDFHKLCDVTVVVYVNMDTQIHRLMERDKIIFPEALKKIYAQMPLDDKLSLADYVIDNCHSLGDLDWQIKQLLFRLERMI